MTLETNTALVRRFIDEVFVARREDAIERVNNGLSDVSMEVHDAVAEGDRVAVRLTSRARQTGDFMGMPATGRSYEIEEMHWFRVADGRIREHWHVADLAGMFRQLGVSPPAPAEAGARA